MFDNMTFLLCFLIHMSMPEVSLVSLEEIKRYEWNGFFLLKFSLYIAFSRFVLSFFEVVILLLLDWFSLCVVRFSILCCFGLECIIFFIFQKKLNFLFLEPIGHELFSRWIMQQYRLLKVIIFNEHFNFF